MSICRLTYRDKAYEFDKELDAQEFLDQLPSRVGVEITEAPLLFRLLNAIGAPLFNWREINKAVSDEFGELARRKDSEFDRTITTDHYVALHVVFKSTMDIAETTIGPEDMDKFREARRQQYNLFIWQEARVGDSVCVETLDAITLREIMADRMTPDHKFRETAKMGMAAPHLTRDELLAIKEAKESSEPHPPRAPQNLWQRVASLINW
jgi:hypothetical protein